MAGAGPLDVSEAETWAALDVLRTASIQFTDNEVVGRAMEAHLNEIQNLLTGNRRHRAQLDARRFKFVALLEALFASRLVSNTKDLPEVFYRAVHFLYGADLSNLVQRQLSDGTLRVPSEASLSRARLKMDVLAMLCRREDGQRDAQRHFTMLSTDSSPQGGLDYLMTLEDRVTREAAGNLMLAGADGSAILQWSRQQGVQTTQLPLAIVGSGNSKLPGKFEALFHQVRSLCKSTL